MYLGYSLLQGSQSTKAGVALLVHTSIAMHKPATKSIIDGPLIPTSEEIGEHRTQAGLGDFGPAYIEGAKSECGLCKCAWRKGAGSHL